MRTRSSRAARAARAQVAPEAQVAKATLIATVAAARAGFVARGGGAKRIAVRAALARLLWDAHGTRRLPSPDALDRALAATTPDDLAWLTELSPMGPLYLFPTRPFLRALAAQIRSCGARRVLEVAAGDGHLARMLQSAAPDLEVLATDSGAWERPSARMSALEQRDLRYRAAAGLAPGPDVRRIDARKAIRELKPDLVLASWLPPGPLLEKLIRAPVRHVLEIGAGSGITGDAACWRFPHEFCDALDALGRCRLDERPSRALHTRVTLYLGRTHEEFIEERDHWMNR